MGIKTFDNYILPRALAQSKAKFANATPQQFFAAARNHDPNAINILFDAGKGVIARAFFKYYLGPDKGFWKQRIAAGEDQEFAAEVYAMLLGAGTTANPLDAFKEDKYAEKDLSYVINKFNYYLLRYSQSLAFNLNRENSLEGLGGFMKDGQTPSFVSKDEPTAGETEGSVEGSDVEFSSQDPQYASTEQSIVIQQFLDYIKDSRPDLYTVAKLGSEGLSTKEIEKELKLSNYLVTKSQKELKDIYMDQFAESVKRVSEKADKNTKAGAYVPSIHYEPKDSKKKSDKLGVSLEDVLLLDRYAFGPKVPGQDEGIYAVVVSIKKDDTIVVEAENGSEYVIDTADHFVKIPSSDVKKIEGSKKKESVELTIGSTVSYKGKLAYVDQFNDDGTVAIRLAGGQTANVPSSELKLQVTHDGHGVREGVVGDIARTTTTGKYLSRKMGIDPAVEAEGQREPKKRDYDADYYYSEKKESAPSIGDRVRINPAYSESAKGDIGTVTSYSPSGSFVIVNVEKLGEQSYHLSDIVEVLKESLDYSTLKAQVDEGKTVSLPGDIRLRKIRPKDQDRFGGEISPSSLYIMIDEDGGPYGSFDDWDQVMDSIPEELEESVKLTEGRKVKALHMLGQMKSYIDSYAAKEDVDPLDLVDKIAAQFKTSCETLGCSDPYAVIRAVAEIRKTRGLGPDFNRIYKHYFPRIAKAEPASDQEVEATVEAEVTQPESDLAGMANDRCPNCNTSLDEQDFYDGYCPECGEGLSDTGSGEKEEEFDGYCQKCGGPMPTPDGECPHCGYFNTDDGIDGENLDESFGPMKGPQVGSNPRPPVKDGIDWPQEMPSDGKFNLDPEKDPEPFEEEGWDWMDDGREEY